MGERALMLPLDSRQSGIAQALLDSQGASIEQIAARLQLTHRVVRYNLPSVEAYLAEHGVAVHRRRGVGIWIEADDAALGRARHDLETVRGPAVLDVAHRQSKALLQLLEAAPQPVRSEELEARLGVSRPTVRRDVRGAERWLEGHRLHLRRLPGVGLVVRGSELEVRSALLGLVLEEMPANVLAARAMDGEAATEVDAAGVGAYVARLPLAMVRRILADELRDVDDGDLSMLTAIVSIAIAIDRSRANRPARLGKGRLRSLLDHPVSDAARRITAALEARLGIGLSAAEAAAITESLLGLAELTDSGGTPEAELVVTVDRIVEAAALRLHPALAGDTLLRANLIEHMRRLRVRLRYGLPFSNPLQDEVRRRYPDVYAAAEEILHAQEPIDGAKVPTEEIGFLTMYLAGSLERHRLQPKVRVTVICPAGMATVWILVSRLMAAFPQVEVAQVVSKAAFEDEPDRAPTDLMISTVPLDGVPGEVPSVVVSPLLPERDIRRLTRFLGLPTHA